MFKKLKAAMGAGAASVDAVLTDSAVRPGESVTGVVHLEGGEVEQEIQHISVMLQTVVEIETDDGEWNSKQSFASQQVTGPMTIAPGDRHELAFTLAVPWETPITHVGGQALRGVRMGVETELAIARALDRGDLDPVQIHPLAAQQGVLDALSRQGFRFKGADVERGHLPGGSLPFFQEIEFAPSGQFAGRMNELEVTFLAGPHETRVLMEADMKGSWFSEGTDSMQWFTVPTDGAADLDAVISGQLQALASRRGWW